MPKIKPPQRRETFTLKRGGIFKCGSSGNAMVGLLWMDTRGVLFYEFVHGNVGSIQEPNNIVQLCRSKCIGTLVANKNNLATQMWNRFVSNKYSADCIYKFNYNFET